MRHVYKCPMRWADLDLLGHVNNVTYVDYLQEARVDLLRTVRAAAEEDPHDLTEGAVVVRHEVSYVHPLVFGFRPVHIECWVTSLAAATFTLDYEVFHEDSQAPGGRTVYLRASTVLAPFVFAAERPRRLSHEERAALAPYVEEPAGPRSAPVARLDAERSFAFPLHVRFSDVDAYRHVNNVMYFEYLQESRVRLIADLLHGRDLPPMHFVVAQTDVDYFAPLLWRSEPYRVLSQVAHVGRRSMAIESEILDGDRSLARARVTVVFFDLDSQHSVEPDPVLRERLLEAARG